MSAWSTATSSWVKHHANFSIIFIKSHYFEAAWDYLSSDTSRKRPPHQSNFALPSIRYCKCALSIEGGQVDQGGFGSPWWSPSSGCKWTKGVHLQPDKGEKTDHFRLCIQLKGFHPSSQVGHRQHVQW
jgi:hypothetical protein